MRVSVVYFDGCPSWREAGRLARVALDQLGRADVAVEYVPVASREQAAAAGFAGSPTITVDGSDVFSGVVRAEGMSCRLYRTVAGPAGVPDLADLIVALEGRVRS